MIWGFNKKGEYMKEFMFSGVSKTHKKTLKGYLIVIKTKAYIINPKYITRYINADYIWLECIVSPATIS